MSADDYASFDIVIAIDEEDFEGLPPTMFVTITETHTALQRVEAYDNTGKEVWAA